MWGTTFRAASTVVQCVGYRAVHNARYHVSSGKLYTKRGVGGCGMQIEGCVFKVEGCKFRVEGMDFEVYGHGCRVEVVGFGVGD